MLELSPDSHICTDGTLQLSSNHNLLAVFTNPKRNKTRNNFKGKLGNRSHKMSSILCTWLEQSRKEHNSWMPAIPYFPAPSNAQLEMITPLGGNSKHLLGKCRVWWHDHNCPQPPGRRLRELACSWPLLWWHESSSSSLTSARSHEFPYWMFLLPEFKVLEFCPLLLFLNL